MTDTKHLSTPELADRWHLSKAYLCNLRSEGRGPTYLKLSGRVLYRLEDIEAYESARLVEAVNGR